MAETDGTPRSRKSKPPKGGNAASNGNSRPTLKTRKRAALQDTLPTGAALEARPAASAPAQPAPPTPAVKTSMPTVIRAQQSPGQGQGAVTDTPSDLRSPSKVQPKAGLTRGGRGPLASTLRMELTVQGDDSEPRLTLPDANNPSQAAHNPRRVAAQTAIDWHGVREPEHGHGHGHGHGNEKGNLTLPQGGATRTRKATTPGVAPAFAEAPQTQFEATHRRGSDIPLEARPSLTARRPRRPGERTMIIRRSKSSKRDWVFVVLVVAALGLSASMLLSYRSASHDIVDASAYDDEPYQDDEPDPFAATTLPPQAAARAGAAEFAHKAQESSVSASSVLATELRSEPSGAEVVVGNAVVGTTPVRVARGDGDIAYTLRLPGHLARVVRVNAASPPSITVSLPVSTAQAAPSGNF